MDPPKSWSIHTRPEITAKYEILHRVGSGAYADVYRARRRYDGATVALKEVHDFQSAFREIDALQALSGHPNVVSLIEYFWREDEDAVLVLEFLATDLASLIAAAKKSGAGVPAAELKRWMLQILSGVDACRRSSIVHRDLKPGNLLIAEDGTLKLADFGQARILAMDRQEQEEQVVYEEGINVAEEYLRELDEVKAGDEGLDSHSRAGATCSASEVDLYTDADDDQLRGSYEAEEFGGDRNGCFTSCVGTRWFRSFCLVSTEYGAEVDLWSLGCVFGELMRLEPPFPGTADIDRLSRIMDVLGKLE